MGTNSQLGFIPPSPPFTSLLLFLNASIPLTITYTVIKSAGQGAHVAEGYESLSATGRKRNKSPEGGGLQLLFHLT